MVANGARCLDGDGIVLPNKDMLEEGIREIEALASSALKSLGMSFTITSMGLHMLLWLLTCCNFVL